MLCVMEPLTTSISISKRCSVFLTGFHGVDIDFQHDGTIMLL